MPQFFIDRPVFAWVVAIFITLFGAIATVRLPTELYPDIAPPRVRIGVSYPGATPATMNESVIQPLERELSSAENFLYMESDVDTSGRGLINVTFLPGTDHQMAQVDVQNLMSVVEPRLPQIVRQLGMDVEAASATNLMVVALISPSKKYDENDLGDYFSRHIVTELKRIDGVGRVRQYYAKRALRVWLDPAKLTAYQIGVSEVQAAILEQNAQVSPGRLGADPLVKGTKVAIPLIVRGELEKVEQFEEIILRSNTDGSQVLLKDVAKLELAMENYNSSQNISGAPAVAAGIMLTPGGNAVRTAQRIYDKMESLSRDFPDGIEYTYAYDTAPAVKISLGKVLQTFFEALALVFIIMFLFLQNWRATIIPAVVVPIALLGTFGVMYASGFSINILTSFGMILAIGIIVDDAIVVTENVERIMAEEKLPPKEATRKGMKEITGAIVGITLVLSAVFVPIALASGAIGQIYRQFSMSLSVSILFSAFLALSLTPAMCGSLLKQHEDHGEEGEKEKKGFFGWFNRGVETMTEKYALFVGWSVNRVVRTMIIYLAICVATGWLFMRLPGGFLPVEDQGSWLANVQLDPDASSERTDAVLKDYLDYLDTREDVEHVLQIRGFGFSGSGPNVALMFVIMKEYEDRKGSDVFQEVDKANARFAGLADGSLINVIPPAIRSLGNNAGFAMRLMDRRDQGQEALLEATNAVLRKANQSDEIAFAYMEGLGKGTMIELHIDRKAALNLGVSFSAISSTISASLGSRYVNDFPNNGLQNQVILQVQPQDRMNIDEVMRLPVRANNGEMVPLSSVAYPEVIQSPLQLVRYNGNPATRISGAAAPGTSSGQAMDKMEAIAREVAPTYGVDWTELSYQERLSGNEAPILLGLSLLVVFLVLAALYESWTIPLSVILVVPLGVFGAVAAVGMRGLPNDIFFKVGIVTLIGLSAKNAILIVEFAKQLEEEGEKLIDATIHAAKLRLRPILMTSLAFGLGVTPMVIEGGMAANAQHAIGTSVLGGIISGTVFAVLFVPAFYVSVRLIFGGKKARDGGLKPDDSSTPPPADTQIIAGGQV